MSHQNRIKIIGLVVIVLLTITTTTGAVAYESGIIHLPSSDDIASSVGSSSTEPTQTATSTTTNSTPSSTNTTVSSPSASTSYKDGTYSADGSFYTPDGTESIGVTLTITNDKITTVSIDDSSIYSRESFQYTERFKNGIDSAVVGKNISDVSVYRVSGASLTPIGFNNALETIKNEAAV